MFRIVLSDFFYVSIWFTPIPFLYSEMVWQCTRYRQWLNMISYWNHFIAMDNQRLTKRGFLNDYLLKKGNWSKEIWEIFHKLDLNSVFTDMHKCPLNIIRDKLHRVFFENLEYDINNKPKLRIFKHSREANYLPKYISMILPRYHRSLLSQIRSGTLPIRIESGRINEILEDRLCILCENDVEDEIHFILFCSEYTGCRQTLLSNIQNDSFHTLSD